MPDETHITDEEYFADYDRSQYKNPPLAVDVVVVDPELRVKLIRRRNPPAMGQLALPGAFVKPNELLFDAVRRSLRRYVPEAHAQVQPVQMHVFDGFDRDTRDKVLSVAHICPISHVFRGHDGWTPLAAALNMDLAFDHRGILEFAQEFLKKHRYDPDVVAGFLYMNFNMSDYRDLMGHITGKAEDSSNLRKKATALGVIEPVTEQSKGRRTTYRFSKET